MATDTHGRTARLELGDATLREWDAVVVDATPEGVVLDRSAFYPGGGGQPPDHGVLLWGGVQSRVVGGGRPPARGVLWGGGVQSGVGGVRGGAPLLPQLADGEPVPPAGTRVRGAI